MFSPDQHLMARSSFARWIAFAGVVVVAVETISCHADQLGFPRTPVSVDSPDGRWTAFARNHPNIDPPSQTIWLQPAGGSPNTLRALAPDAEWISAIVWSSDSTRVGFLTMDAVLDVYDPTTRKRVFGGLVRWPNMNYPPRYMVQDLAFSADGRSVSFVPCERTYTPVPGTGSRLEHHIICGNGRESAVLTDLIERQARVRPDGRLF
jgi:hypothetical protein